MVRASRYSSTAAILLLLGGSCGSDMVKPEPEPMKPDLQVSLDVLGAADAGAMLVLTLNTTNKGAAGATGVVVRDSIPVDLEVISISHSGTRTGGVITWPAITLSPGAAVAYTVTVRVPAVGPFQAVLLAEGTETESATGNNRQARTVIVTATPILMIPGHLVGEQFGWEVEAVGDLDGDGAADLAISAPFGSGAASNAGRVYLYSGADGALLRQFDGTAGEWLGVDMDADADFTGDGKPDLIVGAPGANGFTVPGRVHIFNLVDGSTVRTLTGEGNNDRFGWSAAAAGDVNHDGMTDLYVGARDHNVSGAKSGRAYIFSGATWTTLYTIDGPSEADQFGQAGNGVGDLNKDGFADFAIGAPDWGNTANPGRGRVYVYSGATGQELFPPIEADPSGINFGSFWIFSPGDLNGDGVPDVFASDINNNAVGNGSGRAYVFSGANGTPLLTLTGEASGDQYGIAHPAGDLDGDGVTDLVIAAWQSSEGAAGAGKVYLISGASGKTLRTITSTIANENFGFDAFVIGDVNGDGLPDIAVSGGISNTTTGYVKIYAGIHP